MLGYKLKIKSLPVMKWALETQVNDYMWTNHNSKNQIEISFSKFTEKSLFYNNQRFKFKNNNLGCTVGNVPCKSLCQSGEEINIISVSVTVSDFEAIPCNFTEDDAKDTSYILVPAFISELSLSEELTFTKVLHKIIHLSTEISEAARTEFIGAFFDLLKKIDSLVREKLSGGKGENKNAKNIYLKKAKYIIEQHYSEKITLSDVANRLNISPVYLSKIFKETADINFSDYLLKVRLNHAETLLKDLNIPTSKVAAHCGFCDENYFRKQFKKFFGIGIKEYRRINNSSTLFHELPTRKNYKE
ncbi:MAG: helix-turn-helix transcriptional regulator [Ruminococcaceae bacterium]|nr:helix-turn-helix transcriptional regulator [Oscillospiraceae bacterium]